MNSDAIALIDLDGTLTDYHSAMLGELALLAAPGDPTQYSPGWSNTHADAERIPWMEARCDLIKRQPGFWRNMRPIADGFRVVELLRELEFELMILSRGPIRTTSAWTEKADWCREHIPDAAITITHDKSHYYGRVLFDDYPSYVTPWLAHRPRGLVLMLEQPWNRDFEHPQVLKVPRPFTDEHVPAIRAALVHARDR